MTQEELNTLSVEKLPGGIVKVSGEIPYAYLEKYRKHAIEHVGASVEMDGFRKGHVPENILIARVGEMAILQDMAEHTLESVYGEIVKAHDLDVIGYPKIGITKLAKDNPLGFTFEVAVVPQVTLPDYKKIAHEVNTIRESKEVTDLEVDKQIEDILRQKIAYDRLQGKSGSKQESEKTEERAKSNEKVREEKNEEDITKLPLPELTDEYVKTIGQPGQFESVEDLRSKIREHLTIEKEREITSKHRAKITDKIAEKTKVEIPNVLVEAELNQMFAQMEEDLKRAQLSMDDYLAHIHKTKADLQKEWTPNAEKRAKLQLILNAIAEQDGIIPEKARVEEEVSHLLAQYKDADEVRVRTYVTSVLTNDAVMQLLETS